MSATRTSATERRLQEIAAPKLRVAPELVPLDDDLLEEMPLDSLDVANVVAAIDEAFSPIRIFDCTEELRTLREVAAYIDRELAVR